MLTAYDQIAERWLDSNFSSVDGIAQHKRALSFLASTGPGLALNVGCGCSTRFNEHLRARGLDIEGIDCSPRMIELARTSDPNVRLLQADVCSWLPPYPYDFISAWDSIWHVPLARQHQVLLKLMSALKPGGVFVFSAGGTDQPDEHTDSRMGPEVYYGSLGVPGILQAIRDGNCICRHFEFDQYLEKHVYAIAQKAV